MNDKTPNAIIAEKLVRDIVTCQVYDIGAALCEILGGQVLDTVMDRVRKSIIKQESIYSCIIMQKIDQMNNTEKNK